MFFPRTCTDVYKRQKQLRTKVTNSISKVKEETLKQGLYSNPAQALSGAVAGPVSYTPLDVYKRQL